MGVPANLFLKISDQLAVKPQFAGRKGLMVMPCFSRVFVQCPSDPRRGHDAPPRARMVMSEFISCPVHSKLNTEDTPSSSNLFIHARSRGDALKLFGKTRPDVPMKVSSPRL